MTEKRDIPTTVNVSIVDGVRSVWCVCLECGERYPHPLDLWTPNLVACFCEVCIGRDLKGGGVGSYTVPQNAYDKDSDAFAKSWRVGN